MNKHFQAPARHRWFDDWCGARGPALKTLVADIRAEVEALETRTRKRKAVDQRNFEVAVEVVVSNLAHEVLLPSETGRLAILTGNGAKGSSRYDNKALGEPLRALLWHLQELGQLDWHSSVKRGVASSVAPTDAFRERVRAAGISLVDIGAVGVPETIVLASKYNLGADGSGPEMRELVDYRDTAVTNAMRTTMESLNSFVAAADISFLDDGLGPVDTSVRALRRNFVVKAGRRNDKPLATFNLSGRLYGGFWINMPSQRRAGIRINGEPVADLDYGQMFVRLAYAAVGATPPDGDMYAIPGLEGHRPALKKAFNTLLNASRGMTRWPVELTVATEGSDPSEVLPMGWGVKRIKDAILIRHPALHSCLGDGVGLKLMHIESEILVAVLAEMMARGIVGLGIHDGLLTPASRADEVKTIMEEVAVAKVGITIPVSVKTLS